MKIAMIVCGALIAATASVITYRSCVKVPRNLGGYYRPGYIMLGAIGITAGLALMVAGVLA